MIPICTSHSREPRQLLGFLLLHQLVPHRVILALRQLQSVLKEEKNRAHAHTLMSKCVRTNNIPAVQVKHTSIFWTSQQVSAVSSAKKKNQANIYLFLCHTKVET